MSQCKPSTRRPRHTRRRLHVLLGFCLFLAATAPARSSPAATCLNGVVEAGEDCDGDISPCLSCQCISGYIGRAGECDPVCGDGVRVDGEPCDDGNTFDNDGCDSNCTTGGCGNGILNSGEECDAAGGSPTCNADCTLESCGDGTVNRQAGEVCDPPGSNCTDTCQSATCGNGLIDFGSGELCDDENVEDGDSCDSNCTPTTCGNGIRTGGEACDDGNTQNGDGCDSNCTATACGNGIIAGLERCELPSVAGCSATCQSASCGNGVLNASVGELCDDGNLANDDGCDANCTPTECGNGIINAGEECDDGDEDNRDTCNRACLILAHCSPLPQVGCADASAAKLAVRSSRFLPKRNRIRWLWEGSTALPAADFGDPRLFGTTSYALCLYDSAGLQHESRAPGPAVCSGTDCWTNSLGGFTYRDQETLHDGVSKVNLRQGTRAAIRWNSTGRLLQPIVPLPFTPSITVQLVNSEGTCWQSQFATTTRNDQGQLSAR